MNRVLKAMAAAFWHPLRSRLSTFKLVSGVVMALLLSFVFYFFSCAMMEAFRLMTVTPEFDIWVLSEKERSFYQLFFAFVSVILAQSFCMAYWFDGPRRFFEQRHRWAVQIVNGQRNLNFVSRLQASFHFAHHCSILASMGGDEASIQEKNREMDGFVCCACDHPRIWHVKNQCG